MTAILKFWLIEKLKTPYEIRPHKISPHTTFYENRFRRLGCRHTTDVARETEEGLKSFRKSPFWTKGAYKLIYSVLIDLPHKYKWEQKEHHPISFSKYTNIRSRIIALTSIFKNIIGTETKIDVRSEISILKHFCYVRVLYGPYLFKLMCTYTILFQLFYFLVPVTSKNKFKI